MLLTHPGTNFGEVHRTGRKMHPGTWAHDSNTRVSGMFIGYCPNCEYKVVKDPAELRGIIQRYCRDEKSFLVKLLKNLLKHKTI